MHVQEYWAEMQKIAVCVVIHFAHTAIFAYRLDKLLHVCFGTKNVGCSIIQRSLRSYSAFLF